MTHGSKGVQSKREEEAMQESRCTEGNKELGKEIKEKGNKEGHKDVKKEARS